MLGQYTKEVRELAVNNGVRTRNTIVLPINVPCNTCKIKSYGRRPGEATVRSWLSKTQVDVKQTPGPRALRSRAFYVCWTHCSEGTRRLGTDEPVEFEKQPVEVREFRRNTDHFRGIYWIYRKWLQHINRKMLTCNRLDSESLITIFVNLGLSLVSN